MALRLKLKSVLTVCRLFSCYVIRNIVGRTGLADRGNLWAYGPNQCVQVVLSINKDDTLRFLVAKNSKYPNLPSLFPMVRTV